MSEKSLCKNSNILKNYKCLFKINYVVYKEDSLKKGVFSFSIIFSINKCIKNIAYV